MRRSWLTGWILPLTLSIGNAAHAAVVMVTTPAALHATDQINWASLGASGTIVPGSFTINTQNGTPISVDTGGDQPNFKRLDQGNGFIGDFLPGTPLPATNSLGSTHLHFATPVFGAGAYIQHTTYPSFTAYLRADAGSTILAEYTLLDSNDQLGNGTASFIGILSDQRNITDVYFDSFYGLNTVTAGPLLTTPEPATLLLASVIPALLFRQRSKRLP